MTGKGQATIFAPATAAGRAGVAVVRISGPQAGPALERLTGKPLPTPRRATRARLRGPPDGQVLDDGLVLWFPGPASFTGEDVAELQVHGGRAVVTAILEALGSLPGLRPAEAGEFTRRAFDRGKLDLTAAEGLADLVDAETEAQRRQALRQLEGALAALYEGWRERLLQVLAHAEAEIDFPDEGLPDGLAATIGPAVRALAGEIDRHLDDGRRGERLREGLAMAILGPPNAGKSSLLNWLAGRDAAIVAATAGTTRDVIEVRLDLGGFPVLVADTAGLRDLAAPEGADAVEEEGIRRALARAESADLKLVVLDATAGSEVAPEIVALIDAQALVVVNKTDLGPSTVGLALGAARSYPVSVRTGAGLDALLADLTERVAAGLDPGAAPALTRARHRAALGECRESLDRALVAGLPELAAEDLRLAARALGRITGRVGVEEVLDRLFAEFCIGK